MGLSSEVLYHQLNNILTPLRVNSDFNVMPFKWFPYFIYLKEINRNIIHQHNVGLVRPFIFVAHKIPQLGFQYLFLYILANNKLIPVRAYYHVRIALSVCEADGFFYL